VRESGYVGIDEVRRMFAEVDACSRESTALARTGPFIRDPLVAAHV